MKSVDYKYWANYISEIHETLGSPSDIGLELASGNCKLASYLKNEFHELYISDLSFEMLKAHKRKQDAVCCNMIHLPFKIEFDFIFSAFDSINYLDDESSLIEFFKNIKVNLSEDGLFLFDISLKKNSLKYVKQLNRKGKFKGIEYNQISKFDEDLDIHSNILEIKLKDGNIYKEVHKQKIYDFYYYFEVLDLAGLYVLECFDAFSFNDGTAVSDRIQFIVKRKD